MPLFKDERRTRSGRVRLERCRVRSARVRWTCGWCRRRAVYPQTTAVEAKTAALDYVEQFCALRAAIQPLARRDAPAVKPKTRASGDCGTGGNALGAVHRTFAGPTPPHAYLESN